MSKSIADLATDMAHARGVEAGIRSAINAACVVVPSEVVETLGMYQILEAARLVRIAAEDAWATQAAEETFATTRSGEVLPRMGSGHG
jgi:hypothetical protein